MNFLGHYYTDSQLQNPLFNAGLSLPDLFATFNRKWRIRNIDAASVPAADTGKLLAGCMAHLETDKRFHQSAFFKTQIEMLKTLLAKYRLDQPPFRPFFVSHILMELLADRLIMKKLPSLLPQYYADLDQVKQQHLAALQEFLGFGNIEGFWQFFNRFRNLQFMFHYPNIEDFITSLNRIFSRVQQPAFEGATRKAFKQLIGEAEQQMAPDVLNIRNV